MIAGLQKRGKMKDIQEETGIGLRRAQIFREIIRSGSTRRASKVLQITQSAVSQQLKLFEDAVGEKLFIRDRRGLIPTTRAVEIYNRIDRYFETLGHIEREIFGSFAVIRNSLTIAAPHIVCLSLMPRLVAELEKADLSLEFYVRAQNYDQIAQLVLTGEADIGLSRLPLDERFFEWKLIMDSRSVCLLNPEHPLAGRKLLTAEDVVSERRITLDREFASNLMDMNLLAHEGHDPFVSVRTDAVGFTAAFAAHGSGITVVNDFIARQCEVFNLVAIPFQPSVTHKYVVFWRRGSDKASRQAALYDVIVDFARKSSLPDP